MLRKKNSLSLMVSKLDTRLIDKFLSLNISKEDLKKFDELENKEMIAELIDIKNLKNHSESEVYKALDCMFGNNQFFMYCGPILLNINPGPNKIEEYLNLASWMQSNSGISHTKWKPHLYSLMNTVYHSLIKEKKDQVVNFLGQIGSGKTFNLVHSLEFFCFFHSPEGMQMEFFETMHKSMQLMHILGSVFRENNIESSSSGILMRLGFDEKFKICDFDINAKIIDFTLPFSENGRSFSVLHALVTGASPEIKRILDLPERETTLNFFRKFHSNFDSKTKERFKLNDYEIWTRFHSLLNFFDFTKNEVVEILQLMAFVLLCNEAAIGKKRTSSGDEYVINKSVGSKKLSKNLNTNEEDFVKKFGSFKNISEMKNCLISLMKFAYYLVYEYIRDKVKKYLSNYFEKYKAKNCSSKPRSDQCFTQSSIKNIYFIDIPGETKDQTLGGLITNLTNECLNLFSGTEYMSVIDKIKSEKLNLKTFDSIHSFYAVEALIGKEGLINFLSHGFTEKNFKKLKSKIARKFYYHKTTRFIENLSNDVSVDFTFEFKFSNQSIFYNYESLYMETKSLLPNPKIFEIFKTSRNNIVKSQMNFISEMPNNFFTYSLNTLSDLFKPVEGLSPFIVYCIHSNNSLKTFFGEPRINLVEVDSTRCINIPYLETKELLGNSLVFPIVYWEWSGYHEWVEIELFLNEFKSDFEAVKEKIFKNRFKNFKKKVPDTLEDIDLKTLSTIEVVTYILSVLCNSNQYLIGSQYILLKRGTLKKIREVVNNMVNMNKAESQYLVNYLVDGKIRKRSSIDRSRGTPFRRNPSRKGANSIARSGSLTLGSKNQIIASKGNLSSKNFESNNNQGNKLIRNNSVGFKETKPALNEPEKETYYKSHCTLKIFRENPNSIMFGDVIENEKENYMSDNSHKETGSKSNFNLNPIINEKYNTNLNKQTHSTMKSNGNLLNYNLNKANNIQLLEDVDIYNFINYTNRFNVFNYISYNKNLEISNIGINDSVEEIHTTNLESEFDMYKRDNNVIIPKMKHFTAIKNLFDFTKIDGFHIYDYNEFLPHIKMIQTNWRCYKARKIYKIFRFVCRKVLLIQKTVRGFTTKKKYRKFKYANKCIVLIQTIYKRRYFRLCKAATLIQSFFRRSKGHRRYLDKLARKDLGEESEEEIAEQNSKSKNHNLEHNEVLARENRSSIKSELHSISVSKYEKRKSIDQSSLIRRNQLNMSLLAEMEVDTDKRKILDILMNNSSVFKGIANKSVKQLDNDIEIFKKNIAGTTFSKKYTLDGKKIEDRLIACGEVVKLKQAEKKMDLVKKEEKSLIFKPQINSQNQVDLLKHGGNTIQERTEFRKILKEKKMEMLKNKYQEDDTQLTFKPDINKKSKNIKRSVNDLYKWKQKKESEKQMEINKKEVHELEELKKQMQGNKINKVSEMIIQQKINNFQQTKRDDEDKEGEVDFNLWPEITKAYVKEDEESQTKEFFNHFSEQNEEVKLNL